MPGRSLRYWKMRAKSVNMSERGDSGVGGALREAARTACDGVNVVNMVWEDLKVSESGLSDGSGVRAGYVPGWSGNLGVVSTSPWPAEGPSIIRHRSILAARNIQLRPGRNRDLFGAWGMSRWVGGKADLQIRFIERLHDL